MKKKYLIFFFLLLFSCYNKKMKSEISTSSKHIKEKNVLNIGMDYETYKDDIFIDPQRSIYAINLFFNHMSFAYLFRQNPVNGKAQGQLVKSYSLKGDTYTFKLTEAYWSDGKRITANDVYESWFRYLDPKNKFKLTSSLTTFIKGAKEYYEGKISKEEVPIKVIDKSTLQFDIIEKNVNDLSSFLMPGFAVVPIHKIKELGDDWLNLDNLVFSGPFKLISKDDNNFVYVKNRDYFDSINIKLDKIVVHNIKQNSDRAYEDFKSGDLDWIIDETPKKEEYKKELASSKYLKLYNSNRAVGYQYNFKKGILKDKRIRRAMSIVLDKQELIKTNYFFNLTPVDGLIPRYPKKYLNSEKNDKQKLKQAKELLKEANFEGNSDKPLKFYVRDINYKLAKNLVKIWDGLNITVEVKVVSAEEDVKRVLNGDFDLVEFSIYSFNLIIFLELFSKENSLNNLHYFNQDYEDILDEIKQTEDKTKKRLLMEKADKFFYNEFILENIYIDPSFNIINTDKIGGFYKNNSGYISPSYLYIIE